MTNAAKRLRLGSPDRKDRDRLEVAPSLELDALAIAHIGYTLPKIFDKSRELIKNT